MKMVTFILVAILFVTASAPAATRIHQQNLENDQQDLTIPLSPNALGNQVESEQIARARENEPIQKLEFGTSSWQPRSLQVVSRLVPDSAFSESVAPALYLNLIQPLDHFLDDSLSLKVGVQFSEFQRTASFTASGVSESDEQTAYLPALRLGVEWAPETIASKVFHPYLEAALLPSIVFTSRSALDDGESQLGIPVEVALGSLITFSKVWQLNVGVSQTVGKVGDSDFGGFAVNGAVRVSL